MLEWILQLDTKIFIYLNSINNDFLDKVMLFLSYNFIPAIFIIVSFVYLIYKRNKTKFFIPFLFLLITFGLSDSISTRVFKDGFKRLRPMHEPSIMNKVYTAKQGRGGGKYGFVSSHASNTFALCFFIFLLLGKKVPQYKYLFIYAFLVSYSRIYLGKHYPLDIICGAILGMVIAYIVFKILVALEANLLKPSQDQLQ